jgi:hypothetical protein
MQMPLEPAESGAAEAPELFAEELDLASIPTVVDPVVELVRQARADLAGSRLTNPPRFNAFERFSLALRINADSKPAKQGVLDTARLMSILRTSRGHQAILSNSRFPRQGAEVAFDA